MPKTTLAQTTGHIIPPQPIKGNFKSDFYHFDKAPEDKFEENPVISPEQAMKAVQHLSQKM